MTRPSDCLRIRWADTPFSGGGIATMKFYQFDESHELAPVLSVLQGERVALSILSSSTQLAVRGDLVENGAQVIERSLKGARRLVACFGETPSTFRFAINGIVYAIPLRGPIRGAEAAIQLGATNSDYFHFLVDELRLAPATGLPDADLLELSKVTN